MKPLIQAVTQCTDSAWMRFWFRDTFVDMVVIKKGHSHKQTNVYKVSVYNGKEKRLCGTYAPGVGGSNYFDEAAECGGVRGDSLMIELDFCINIYELEIYGKPATGESGLDTNCNCNVKLVLIYYIVCIVLLNSLFYYYS